MCRRRAGRLLHVTVGSRALTGRDGFGQHAEKRPVVGWYPACYRGGDPFVAVNVGVVNGLAADVADDLGRLRDRERLGTGECVLGAGMSLRVGQCRARDSCDVLRVDEGLCAVTSRNHDGAADWPEKGLAEVLHEPRRWQDYVGEALPAEQV